LYLQKRSREEAGVQIELIERFFFAGPSLCILRIPGTLCGIALPRSGKAKMTQLEVAYHYHAPLREATMRALDNMREVYGVRRISFNEREHIVRVEFDASRFKEPVIAGLLRGTGLDLGDQLLLA
jgi:hypothetical protein